MSVPNNWTDVREAHAAKLWLAGKSATQIAKLMGGVTRNAIIAKMHRLGHVRDRSVGYSNLLAANRAKPPTVHVWRPKDAAAKPTKARGPLSTTITGAVVGSQPADILGLHPGLCRWPISGEGGETLFCCAPSPERVYCTGHGRVAYQRARPA